MNFLVKLATRNLRVHCFSHSLFMHLAIRLVVIYVWQHVRHASNSQYMHFTGSRADMLYFSVHMRQDMFGLCAGIYLYQVIYLYGIQFSLCCF